MIRAVRAFMAGAPPPGLGVKPEDYARIGSWERIIPKSQDWRAFDPSAPG